ncbi:MAG: hypothetical protein KAQ99_07940, partial [Candidatus Aureabacteria bacterium]|nr:hypothetical protein [Candidatus Auribacterota bacterium]
DLGETTEVAGLGDLFTHATDVVEGVMPLKEHIGRDYAPAAPVIPDNAYAIAGFGDAMLLDGMTLDEVETLINSAIAPIDYIAADKAINILRGLTTILTRADLLSSGVHESVINQFELTALRNLFHGTANDDGIGSVLTYTGALGFVEVSEGIYQAEVINTAYVLAGYSIEEMAAYYTNPDPNQNPWASRGWTLADFTAPYSGGQAVTGVEDYDFGTGTAHITYYGMIHDDYLIKLGLFDEGLLEEWIGKPLPGSFDLKVISLGGTGAYKRNYQITYIEGTEKVDFAFVVAFNVDEMPTSLRDQFKYFMRPAYDYWLPIVGRDGVPVPRIGSAIGVLDEYGKSYEVGTRGLVPAYFRGSYEFELVTQKIDISAVHNMLIMKESAALYQIWRATGSDETFGFKLQDLSSGNVAYELSKTLGTRFPQYFDFDVGTPNVTFASLYNGIKNMLVGNITDELPATVENEKAILIGIYNAMRA